MEEREIGRLFPWEMESPAELPAEQARKAVFTVTELTRLIKVALEEAFFDVWVEGEVSNLRQPASGHTYFTLKDEVSQVRAVLFKSQKRALRFRLEDGLQVIARGRVSLYEPRGEYQIIVDTLEPKGIGALLLALQQLKERLAAEGLFDDRRKQPIPVLPQRIGVVTSSTGAAIRDILRVVHRRFANVSILLYPARVQGNGASREIAEGIRALNRFQDIDVLIVGRGGGSMEDLWAFNEEEVVRAIAASRIPVISAVGHEIDFTLADLAADLRAPTPSAAAELVVKNKEDLFQELQSLQVRLRTSIRHILARRRDHLEGLRHRRGFHLPRQSIQAQQQRLDDLAARQERSVSLRLQREREHLFHLRGRLALQDPRQRLALQRERLGQMQRDLISCWSHRVALRRKNLESLLAGLNALSPLAILGRGYSICRHLPSGRVVTDARQMQDGDRVEVRLHQGELRCRVEEAMGTE